MMKSFKFQQFEIQQSKKVFRVGTDAVLLGVWANVSDVEKILEVGTGTGIVSLMLAQRNPKAKIIAIDIDENAVNLAKLNFQNSPFSERLKVIEKDFNQFETKEKFDFVVSNPPYFEENTSSKDVLARQKITLNFQQLIQNAAKLLSENATFCVIIPSDFGEEILNLAEKDNLFLTQKINIFGIKGGELKRLILTFSKNFQPLQETNFVIEKSPRNYSDDYLERTKAFHAFNR